MKRKEKMFKEFASNAKAEDVQKIDEKLPFMKRGPIVEIWPKVIALFNLIKDPKAAWGAKAVAIGALIYLIATFDAIPDVIPIFGLTDDAAVIMFAFDMLSAALREYCSGFASS